MLGIATAAGSAGQVFGAPLAEALLRVYPWQGVFVIFAGLILATLFALPFLRSPKMASRTELEESLGTVLIRAFKDPSYSMIFLGFFSCGYQLAFITAHFPAFVTERCGPIDPSSMLAGIGQTNQLNQMSFGRKQVRSLAPYFLNMVAMSQILSLLHKTLQPQQNVRA